MKHLERGDEIFVFGSNANGFHNGGAALRALTNYGAIYGRAEGIQGCSYAIPTVGVTFAQLARAVGRFCDFVELNPQFTYKVTAIGCGSAGFSPFQIAPLFARVSDRFNVKLPMEFKAVLNSI